MLHNDIYYPSLSLIYQEGCVTLALLNVNTELLNRGDKLNS